jgi:hypothetical protein
VAVLGYWFQKRLEIFKRDQGLASELAKARIAAYNRAFAAVGVFHAFGSALLIAPPGRREPLGGKLDEAHDKLVAVVREDGYLLGDPFKAAVVAYMHRLRDDATQALSNAPLSAEEQTRRRDRRDAFRAALVEALPPFARIPERDQAFKSPDFNLEAIEVLMEIEQQGGAPRPLKGETP